MTIRIEQQQAYSITFFIELTQKTWVVLQFSKLLF